MKIEKNNHKTKTFNNILIILLIAILIITSFNKLGFSKENNSSTIFSSAEMIIQYQKTNTIILQREEKSLLDYVTLYSYYYPENLSSQEIVDFTSNYNKIKKNKKTSNITPYIFNITHPTESSINVTQTFLLDNKINYPKITTITQYIPIENNYTKFSKLIDINNDIKKKANELASTSNDTFQIAVNIANWINKNVKYSLTSIADNPKETSTWVFYHKVGVCKEITNLYISMLRSIGIPSRVVIGQAYTNDPIFKKSWIGHAWAEVYINNKWIPFDLTYHEYGYIDPSHITFQKFKNYSYEKSDSITTKGYRIKISNFSMIQNIKILKTYPEFNTDEKVELIPDKKELKFGSIDYITLKVNNLNNFYKYKKYYLVGPKEITLSKKNISILLKPYQTKTIYINFKIKNDLENNYIYTLPIALYDSNYKEIQEIDIKASNDYTYIHKEISIKNRTTINRIEKYSNVSCILKKYNITNNYQQYLCTFVNKNPNMLQKIKICFNKKCFLNNFLILENKTYIFNTNKTDNIIIFGNKEYTLYLNKTEATKITKNTKNSKLNNSKYIEKTNIKQNNTNKKKNSTSIKTNYYNTNNKNSKNISKINNNLNINNHKNDTTSKIIKERDRNIFNELLNLLKSIKKIILFIFT